MSSTGTGEYNEDTRSNKLWDWKVQRQVVCFNFTNSQCIAVRPRNGYPFVDTQGVGATRKSPPCDARQCLLLILRRRRFVWLGNICLAVAQCKLSMIYCRKRHAINLAYYCNYYTPVSVPGLTVLYDLRICSSTLCDRLTRQTLDSHNSITCLQTFHNADKA